MRVYLICLLALATAAVGAADAQRKPTLRPPSKDKGQIGV